MDCMSRKTTEPLVTVIMPIRNEEAFIELSLGAVLAQDYPAECLEILIADGMSDDATVEKIGQMPDIERVRILPNPERIQAAGLNMALQEAQGEIIIRVDGHTVIAPDYVRQCVAALHQTGAQNVGGAMDPVGTTWIGKAIAAAGKSPFAVPTAFHVTRRPQLTDTVYLGAWPRSVFDQVGLYNARVNINEDYELNYRIRKAGGQVYFTPAIRSRYYGRQTLQALAKQYTRYGAAKVRTLFEHPRSVRPRHLIAPAFTIGLLLGAVLGLFSTPVRLAWAIMVGSYLAADLAFSMRTAARHGWRLLPLLPLVFPIIHLSWGAGFWVETAREVLRRFSAR